jgi:hypothetical protein
MSSVQVFKRLSATASRDEMKIMNAETREMIFHDTCVSVPWGRGGCPKIWLELGLVGSPLAL